MKFDGSVKTHAGVPGVLGLHPPAVVAHLVVDDILNGELLLQDGAALAHLI